VADVPVCRLLATLRHGLADTWSLRAEDAGPDGTIKLGALPAFADYAAKLFGGLARANASGIAGLGEKSADESDRGQRNSPRSTIEAMWSAMRSHSPGGKSFPMPSMTRLADAQHLQVEYPPPQPGDLDVRRSRDQVARTGNVP